MGLGIKWFKDYKISNSGETYGAFGFCCYDKYSINLIEADSTSHSYGSVGLVTSLFEKTIGKPFPKIPNEECIDSEDYNLNLVKPEEMSKYCQRILDGAEVDCIDMRERVEWFKELSDKGYYIAYDWQ